jgi:flagella basal body P-ring formation protein FlgA
MQILSGAERQESAGPVGFRRLAARARAALLIGLLAAGTASGATGTPPPSGAREAAEPVLISLRAESTIRGAGIRLGDLADIQGGDPALVMRLRAVEVGRTPLPGLSRTLDLPYIKARLRLAQIDLAGLTWDVPPAVTVVAASQRVTGGDLAAAAREQVHALRAAEGTPASIQPTAIPPDLILPAGTLELKARVRPGAELTGTVPVAVEVWVDGVQVRSLSVGVKVVPLVEVLVAARLIPRHTLLGPEDVKVERRPLGTGTEPLREPAAALQQRALRTISPGEPILATLLEFPPLVRRGEIVTLTVQGPGLVAVTQGEAREDGKAGQIIRVRNRASGREVYGQVEGERSVRVSF